MGGQTTIFTPESLAPSLSSEWSPPSDWPDRLYGPIGIDLETCDLGLCEKKGPGWAWEGGGFVAGYAIAADNFTGYLPIAHRGAGNIDPSKVRRWLNHVLADETQPKVGANVMYDLGWAERDGVTVRGPVYDVQWAEALLDEHRRTYALDALALDTFGVGKSEGLLREAADAYEVDPKAELWKLPPKYVGPYAEQDAVLARKLFATQAPRLSEEGLSAVFELECGLIPLYLDMRRRGVRVDMDRADALATEWRGRERSLLDEMTRKTGLAVDIWSAASLAKAFRSEGLDFPSTEKGTPSFTSVWLERHEHWLPKAIVEIRRINKLRSTFIEGAIMGHARKGRIHCEFHPLRTDDSGTVTGRLSASNPNLQQVPARTEDGRRIRGCFIPEDGEQWYKLDHSQQEPRMLVHFASVMGLPGADDAISAYERGEDFYTLVQELAAVTRSHSKTLTLARIYGRGVASTAAELGLSMDEARALLEDQFDKALPFVPRLAQSAQDRVISRGYVTSILGRRMRFPFYEPKEWKKRKGRMLPREEALKEWGPNIIRARIHKALNSVIQPSAADQTKSGMKAVLDAGLGRYVLLQVHDELDLSVGDPKIAQQVRECMEDALPLRVPSKVDVSSGPNWGQYE